jgi:hypothetical protein
MLEPSLTSQVAGVLLVAGFSFTAGFITAVRDYRKAERKKKQVKKVAELQALWEDEIKVHDQKVIEEYNAQMALLRKASISDNDWGMAEVL